MPDTPDGVNGVIAATEAELTKANAALERKKNAPKQPAAPPKAPPAAKPAPAAACCWWRAPSAILAMLSPWSAALLNQCIAKSRSLRSPYSPLRYQEARLYCESTCPRSEA